jgi:hypothetical protein
VKERYHEAERNLMVNLRSILAGYLHHVQKLNLGRALAGDVKKKRRGADRNLKALVILSSILVGNHNHVQSLHLL